MLGVDAMQQLAGALALLLQRAGAFGARIRDDAGDLAGAAGGAVERLVEQAGEALESLLDVVGAVSRVATRVSIPARRSLMAASAWRLLLSINCTASARLRPCASNEVASCPRSTSALLVMEWNALMCWSTWLVSRRCARRPRSWC